MTDRRSAGRRMLGALVAIAIVAVAIGLLVSSVDHSVQELALPLSDASVIR